MDFIKKTTTYADTISWSPERFASMLAKYSNDTVIKVYSKHKTILGTTTVGEVRVKNKIAFTKGYACKAIIIANFNREHTA